MTATPPHVASPAGPATVGPWAPLRHRAFRILWIAGLASAIGTWMQTVGAQWLLVDEPNAATLVSLVQTAGMLPVLILSLPAGVLADSLDRRLLLLAVQTFQVATAGLLTIMTLSGAMTPELLLALTFAIGCGTALTMPAWQASIPDLVRREELPSAAALGGINQNLARAAGPAVAGLLISRFDVAIVFGINTFSFAVFVIALLFWRPETPPRTDVPERFVPALRAGGRFIRHSRVVRRILFRLALFLLPAAALWALLPLAASRSLGLGADGYGVLLAALGLGAVAGAMLLPRARRLMSMNTTLIVGSVVYAGSMVGLTFAPSLLVAVAVLVPAGACWTGVLSSVNASVQLFLPQWVRARGLAAYTLVVFGGQAVGSLPWGLVAQHFGLRTAFLAAAIALLLGAATVPFWGLHDTAHLDRSPAYRPDPHLAIEPSGEVGPVVVAVTYVVAPDDEPAFLAAMGPVRRARQRTGAIRWAVYRDGEQPDRLVETYVVPTWDEHLRQHSGRLTASDLAAEERVNALSQQPPMVTHLLPAGQTAQPESP